MKEEIKGDAELPQASSRPRPAAEIVPALRGQRARPPLHRRARRALPEGVRLARVWSHEFIFPSFREDMNPGHPARARPGRRRLRLPGQDRQAARPTSRPPTRDPRGSPGRGARGDARCQRDQPEDGTAHAGPPLLHRPGRQRPRPARARGASARSSSRQGVLDAPTTSSCSATTSCARSSATQTASTVEPSWRPRGAKRAEAEQYQPKDWVGTATATQLAFPYLNLWGFPDKFYRSQQKEPGKVTGIAGSPGVVEGIARVVSSEAEFDSLAGGRDPRLPDDQPGLAGALRQDHRRGHRCRRDRLAPGRPGPRVRHPRRRGHLARGTVEHQDRRSPPRRRQRRRGRDPGRRLGRPPVGWHGSWLTMADDGSSRAASSASRSRVASCRRSLTAATRPGARIVETRVAREFGTSQAPVREALRDLEALGVVETRAVPWRSRATAQRRGAARGVRGAGHPGEPRCP